MAFGLGVLKLSPQSFWAMTPRELAAALNGTFPRAGTPLRRDDIAALMRRFPDVG